MRGGQGEREGKRFGCREGLAQQEEFKAEKKES